MEDYANFLEHHQIQLVYSGVPAHLWPSLFSKLKNEIFDAGNFFTMLKKDYDDGGQVIEENDGFKGRSIKVFCIQDISISHSDCIFLIDHAWTYQLSEAELMLIHSVDLLNRMCDLMEIDKEDKDRNELVKCVMRKMWLFNQTYSIEKLDMDVAKKVPLWYIMDEFGSSLSHSNEPNFRLVPFYCTFQQISYSLLFPIKNARNGDEITRNFVEGYSSQDSRLSQFYLLPWFVRDFSHLPFNNIIEDDSFYHKRQEIELPDENFLAEQNWSVKKPPFKVYMDNVKMKINLTDTFFEIVENDAEADILWLDTHLEDFKNLFETSSNVYVNQFAFEELLTAKDLLAAIVHSVYANFDHQQDSATPLITWPPWLATTFNLSTELPAFVSYFQNREKLNLDNTWIIKPWNLARGIDTCVTHDLNQIIRLIDNKNKWIFFMTGFRYERLPFVTLVYFVFTFYIACKYIENPVLFHRDDIDASVKFDMRFIVMLKSVKPLELYVYNRFWLRFALKAFSLDDLDDYEKHFTVFNYTDSGKIKQMFCNDFIDQFSEQYPEQDWSKVQESIYQVIKDTFRCVTMNSPPKGLFNWPQCRAMYGIDMMLRWTDEKKNVIQPVLLEVNFMPDCNRACNYYSDFVNTVFRTLFCSEKTDFSSLPITLL